MYGKLVFPKVLIPVCETWLLVTVKKQNKKKAKQVETKENKTKQSTSFIFSRTFKMEYKNKMKQPKKLKSEPSKSQSIKKKDQIKQYLSFGCQIQNLVSDALTCLSLTSFVTSNDN